MRKLSSLALLINLCISLCDVTALNHTDVRKTSIWRAGPEENVTDAELVLPVTSKTYCLWECRSYSHCMTWAFDDKSSTCYLQPATADSVVPIAKNIRFFTDVAPLCQEHDAPAVSNNLKMTLRRSLTSLVGDVTCPADFMYPIDVLPQVRCLAAGQWVTQGDLDGECKQRIWRDGTAQTDTSYLLPRTPAVGWSMCLQGSPTADSKFSVNLRNSAGNAVFHVEIRLKIGPLPTKATFIGSDVFGLGWTTSSLLTYPMTPFPFVAGEQFDMKITASETRLFTVYVNGELYTTFPVPAATTDVTHVNFADSLQIDLLDLWCWEKHWNSGQ
ncbi:hypothetical protein BaRGS_00012374 [Batillaria attramentaria]|uniref:Galectin n=1 Tax=Batillaria attramentaria TaxID=370345 RepID=A0ABD0LBW6_9CAEN